MYVQVELLLSRTSMHARMRAFMHTHVRAFMHTHMRKFMHARMRAFMHTHEQVELLLSRCAKTDVAAVYGLPGFAGV